jgi:hypothetical protein
MQIVVDKVLSNPLQITSNTRCLLAAIKFAAVTSLSDDNCLSCFNIPRQILLDLFRTEVQNVLSVANFITSQDLATLQAFTIYLVIILPPRIMSQRLIASVL